MHSKSFYGQKGTHYVCAKNLLSGHFNNLIKIQQTFIVCLLAGIITHCLNWLRKTKKCFSNTLKNITQESLEISSLFLDVTFILPTQLGVLRLTASSLSRRGRRRYDKSSAPCSPVKEGAWCSWWKFLLLSHRTACFFFLLGCWSQPGSSMQWLMVV